MRKPQSVKSLENFGRVRLSKSFYMRDLLYSEISNIYGTQNIPDNPDIAIEACSRLCKELLEPLNETFGRISIFSGYRSPAVNQTGNENKLNCASNKSNYAGNIFDYKDTHGNIGATQVQKAAESLEQASLSGQTDLAELLQHVSETLEPVIKSLAVLDNTAAKATTGKVDVEQVKLLLARFTGPFARITRR